MNTVPSPRRTHLLAFLGAVLLAVFALGIGFGWARGVQERLLHSVAPEFCDAKLHGVALIREALSRPDTLLLFGSSELIPDVPMKGVDFFANSPTGFSVFPVGKAGTTALSVLQKLGGAGEALSGKKVVLSLSPSFFQSESVDPKYFEGNSSKLQTKEMLWSSVFSESLKQAAALQILKYPKAYEGDWMLEFTLQRIARGGWMDRIALALMEPYAFVDRAVNRFQDHAEATAVLLESPEAVAAKEVRSIGMRKLPNWDELFALAEQSSKKFAARAKRKALKVTRRLGEGDLQFVNRVQNAQEWHDFELVLRLLREAGAQPLVISMPVHADVLEAQGISKRGWMEYGRRLKSFTARYGTPLVYLEEHERDPVFFVDQADHIGSKGWWFYNKAMDDFFHGRVMSQPMASQTILRK